MSSKKGKPSALKLMKLAEAWAREANEELELAETDVEPVVQAVKVALHRHISRKA
jgi:uncharacterized protein (DUF2267 family)